METRRSKSIEVEPKRTSPVTAPTDDIVSGADPNHEQIARRAYELFLARGGENGHAQEDWLQAERETGLGQQ